MAYLAKPGTEEEFAQDFAYFLNTKRLPLSDIFGKLGPPMHRCSTIRNACCIPTHVLPENQLPFMGRTLSLCNPSFYASMITGNDTWSLLVWDIVMYVHMELFRRNLYPYGPADNNNGTNNTRKSKMECNFRKRHKKANSIVTKCAEEDIGGEKWNDCMITIAQQLIFYPYFVDALWAFWHCIDILCLYFRGDQPNDSFVKLANIIKTMVIDPPELTIKNNTCQNDKLTCSTSDIKNKLIKILRDVYDNKDSNYNIGMEMKCNDQIQNAVNKRGHVRKQMNKREENWYPSSNQMMCAIMSLVAPRRVTMVMPKPVVGLKAMDRSEFIHGEGISGKRVMGFSTTDTVTERYKNSKDRYLFTKRYIMPSMNYARHVAIFTIFTNALSKLSDKEILFLKRILELSYYPANGLSCRQGREVAQMISQRSIHFAREIAIRQHNVDRKCSESLKNLENENSKDEVAKTFRQCKQLLDVIFTRRMREVGRNSDGRDTIKKVCAARQGREKNMLIEISPPNCLCHIKCSGEGIAGRHAYIANLLQHSIHRFREGSVICGLCRVSQTVDNTTSLKSKPLISGLNPGIQACSVCGCTTQLYAELLVNAESIDGRGGSKVQHRFNYYTTNASNVISCAIEPEKSAALARCYGPCYSGSRLCRNHNIITLPSRESGEWIGFKSDLAKYPERTWRCSSCYGNERYNPDCHSGWNASIHEKTCINVLGDELYICWRDLTKIFLKSSADAKDRLIEKHAHWLPKETKSYQVAKEAFENHALSRISNRMCDKCMISMHCNHTFRGFKKYIEKHRKRKDIGEFMRLILLVRLSFYSAFQKIVIQAWQALQN